MGKKGFQKGKDWTGNRKGRPADPIIAEVRAALEAVEKKKGKKLLTRLFERAFKNDKVLIAAAKKVAPDMSHTTGEVKFTEIPKIQVFLNDKGK